VGAPGVHRSAVGVLLLALVAGGLFFQDLGRYPLWDPDEARHAEVAREMASGQGIRRFILPTLGLTAYREKPPGYYWLVTASYTTVGVSAGAARAVNAIAALLLVLVLYAWALRRMGFEGALAAGLVAATSAGYFGLARYANLDMTFTAFVTLGVLAGLAWLERPAPRRPPLLTYAAAGVATLVKGPLGFVLIGAPLMAAVTLQRERPTLRELGLVRGTAIVVALVAPLVVAAALLDPAYVTAFAATNVRRFGEHAPHAAPVYYYALWLPVLAMPWTLLAIPAVRHAAGTARGRVLLAWAVLVPAVMTLASGKLATYVLPALPPIALVVGPYVARVWRDGETLDDDGWLRAGGWCATVLVAAAGVGVIVARWWYPVPIVGIAVLLVLGVGWSVALVTLLRAGSLQLLPPAMLGAMLTLYPAAVRWVAPAVSAVHSDADLARRIPPGNTAPVISFASRAPSLTFYTGAPVIETDDPDVVRDLFAADAPAFLATGNGHFAEIEQLLGPRAHVWYTTRRRRLYGNQPPPE
jgi:4-amino-4-deoxy-L-arabinose transferase-like glycosyltransferase